MSSCFLFLFIFRWTKWKLEENKIAELTQISETQENTKQMVHLQQKIWSFRFFARGKRGILYTGERKIDQLAVVV